MIENSTKIQIQMRNELLFSAKDTQERRNHLTEVTKDN